MRLGQVEAAELCSNEARQVNLMSVIEFHIYNVLLSGVSIVTFDSLSQGSHSSSKRGMGVSKVVLSECPLYLSLSSAESPVSGTGSSSSRQPQSGRDDDQSSSEIGS